MLDTISDFLYKYGLGIIIVFTIVLIIGLVQFYTRSKQEYDRLMSQCQADGHKEYECRSMLRSGGGSHTVMPMPIRIR